MSDVRISAERLLKQWSSSDWKCECDLDVGAVPCFNCGMAHAICDVTKAYLAEHLSDDDEPVTKKWLSSVGFSGSSDTNIIPGPMEWFDFPDHPEGELLINLMNRRFGDTKLVTRSDVRKLCQISEVELKECKNV